MWFPMVRRGVRFFMITRASTASVPHAGDANYHKIRHLDVHVEILHLRALPHLRFNSSWMFLY